MTYSFSIRHKGLCSFFYLSVITLLPANFLCSDVLWSLCNDYSDMAEIILAMMHHIIGIETLILRLVFAARLHLNMLDTF